MTKRIFLSLTLLFCCKAYVNAMDNKKINLEFYQAVTNREKIKVEKLIMDGADSSQEIYMDNVSESKMRACFEMKEQERYYVKTTPLNLALYFRKIGPDITNLLIKKATSVNVPFICVRCMECVDDRPFSRAAFVDTKNDSVHVLISGQKTVTEKISTIGLMKGRGFNLWSANSHHINSEGKYCRKENALHILCNIGYPEKNSYKIANVLIQIGVNVNHKNSNGNAPANLLAKRLFSLITKKQLKQISVANPITDDSDDNNKPSHFNREVYSSEEYLQIFKNIALELKNGGADFRSVNNKKRTPRKIVQMLSSKYSNIFTPIRDQNPIKVHHSSIDYN